MAQTGNTREGKAELEAGLKGLGVWLQKLVSETLDGQFWDPDDRLANGISQLRKMLQAERPDWQGIAANVEWLGKALEEEIEEVKDDKEIESTYASDGSD